MYLLLLFIHITIKQNEQSNYFTKREAAFEEAQLFIKHEALPLIIQHFISDMQLKESGKKNVDYGNHYKTLHFPTTSTSHSDNHTNKRLSGKKRVAYWDQGLHYLPNTKKLIIPNCSVSYGLVRDKESPNSQTYLQLPENSSSECRKDCLKKIARAIFDIGNINSYYYISKTKLQTLRMNVVVGANTIAHTDVLRHSLLPNYLIIYSPYKNQPINFQLNILTWPHFKTSIVTWNNKLIISFEFNAGVPGEEFNYCKGTGGYIKTFCRTDDGKKAKWLILPPSELDNFKPYKKVQDKIAVGGIVDGELYIISSTYKIINKWNEVEKVDINFLFDKMTESTPDTY